MGHPYKISIDGPVEPALNLKEKYTGFYLFLWVVMVATVVLFGWHVFFFLVPILMGYTADFYSLKVVLFIIQMSLQLVAAITTWRLKDSGLPT